MTTDRLSNKNLIFIILLYLCLIYLPYIISRTIAGDDFMKGDCYYYQAVIVSLVEDGDLLLENNIPDPLGGQLAIGKEGLVLVHPIMMPLVSLPFYLLFGTPGLLLFNVLNSMILLILIFKLNGFFFDRIIAFIITILYATGTLLLDYVYNYSPDIFSSILLLGGLYLVLRERFYGGAVLLGLSIFAKIPNAPLVAVILLYAVWSIWRRKSINGDAKGEPRGKVAAIIATGAFFALALIPFFYTNYLQFGSPIVTGYQRMAIAGADGAVVSVDHLDMFNQPLLIGASRILFDIGNGILMTNPVLILAFIGASWIKKTRAQDGIYLILLICLIQFIMIAKYDAWSTSHFSNRFLMTFIVLSSVFASNFLSHLSLKYSLRPAILESSS